MGEAYLSLTYAAAIFMVAMAAVLAGLLARSCGGGLGLLVASAVVIASAGQHTIIWYNAMGVAWLAVVVWASAQAWPGERSRVAACVLVAGALWLGGMTKLTYQAAALAFAVVLAMRRKIGGKQRAGLIVGIVVLGVLAPVATEMALTGASFAQWKKNVLELAASRADLLKPIATWGFYWHTPHDYHQPLYLPFVGAWGVALMLAAGGAAAWRLARERAARREWVFLTVLWGGGMACGLAFLALHLEIAYMAGAAWLVLATGLVLALVPRAAEGPSRLARGALAIGAVTLFVPAWFSAWAGARAIWSQRPLVRSELVSTEDLPGRFSYLRGMRILPEWHASLRVLERMRDELAREGIEESAWYFVNGTEWLVRAMPEARHRGLPLWLQHGTTYGEVETPSIARRLERGSEMKVIVSHHPWAFWRPEIESVLNQRYDAIDIGPAFKALRVRDELDWPLQFAERFNSNLYSRDLEASGGALEMRGRVETPFFGAHESAQLALRRGVYRLSGDLVAELAAGEPAGPVAVRFRARKSEGGEKGALLWDEEVVLTAEARASVRPFSISPGGARVALEVELPSAGRALAGWRSLQTEHAGEDSEGLPVAVTGGLAEERLDATRREALLAEGHSAVEDVLMRGEASASANDERKVLIAKVPNEIWIRLKQTDTQVSGAVRVTTELQASRVRVVVAYYKSGRFERLFEHEFSGERKDGEAHRFDVGVRERGGWAVLLAVPGEQSREGEAEVHWSSVSVR